MIGELPSYQGLSEVIKEIDVDGELWGKVKKQISTIFAEFANILIKTSECLPMKVYVSNVTNPNFKMKKSSNLIMVSSGSGLLEFTEFCHLASWFLKEEDETMLLKELKEAFRIYDKDEEGWVDYYSQYHFYKKENVQFHFDQLPEGDLEGAGQSTV